MKTSMRLVCCVLLGLSAMCVGLSPCQAADDDGFRPIFDGKTLDGWDGDPAHWSVQDGVIVGKTTADQPAKYNTFLIWRGGKPGDFELKAEFKLHNHNSGIQIRSWEEAEKWRVSGYQADMDESGQFNGALYGENFRGMLAEPGEKTVIGKDHKRQVVGKVAEPAEVKAAIHNGEWNEYHIIVRGNHITLKVNGQITADVVDKDKEMRRKDGVIALQLHQGQPMKVEFRNIRLKETKKEAGDKKKIVFLAGGVSHGYSDHEHYAGCLLLAKCLNENMPGVNAVVYKGWPEDAKVLDDAAAIVIYSDGDGGSPAFKHMEELDKLAKKGVGVACIHYAVEMPTGKEGDLQKGWIGGYFEKFWSVNPFWKAEFREFPKHPVANGVKPFSMTDEWYYHMRFLDDMKGVTPILTSVPPDSTRKNVNESHAGNPAVFARMGMPEHVAWVCERPDGGRGFGFTGGHAHWSWACDSFRTVVLNGIVWTAKLDVPAGGVPSKTPTFEELEINQDKPQPANYDKQAIKNLMEEWKKEAAAAK